MDTLGIISTVVSIISVCFAGFALHISSKSTHATISQAERAMEANTQTRQIGQSEAVIHFTSRFFDLMKDGSKFTDQNWAYQYWSLQATEFYFFHNNWIPLFMYRLWMVELASMYNESAEAWKSHAQYLRRYSSNYPDMCDFFRDIRDIAVNDDDAVPRNRKIEEFIDKWKESHRLVV